MLDFVRALVERADRLKLVQRDRQRTSAKLRDPSGEREDRFGQSRDVTLRADRGEGNRQAGSGLDPELGAESAEQVGDPRANAVRFRLDRQKGPRVEIGRASCRERVAMTVV